MFVKLQLTSNEWLHLCISTRNFETVCIEIENAIAKNILWCYVFRHPKCGIALFNDHMHKVTLSIANENKLACNMGHVNIHLLKYEFDTLTCGFINPFYNFPE